MNRAVLVLVALTLVSAVAPATVVAAGDEITDTTTIDIDEPRYHDGQIKTVKDGNRTVHVAEGNHLEISLSELNHSAVKDYGLTGDTGSLTYDSDEGEYVLDAEETSGAYTLWWTVNERRNVTRGNRTVERTVTVRYQAVVRVESANVVHKDADEWSTTKDRADNWTQWSAAVMRVSSADSPSEVKSQSQSGLDWIKATNQPWAYLTGDFFGYALSLVTSPQGLLIIGGIVAFSVPTIYVLYRYKNRRESQDPEEATLDEKLDEYSLRRLEQTAEGTPLSSVWPDAESAAQLRKAMGADSLHTALSKYFSLFLNERMVRDRLSTMGSAGYRAAVKTDAIGIVDAHVLEPEEEPPEDESYEVVDLDDPSEDLAKELKTDPVVEEVHLPDVDAEPTADVEPVVYDLETLLTKIDEDLPKDVESQRMYSEYLIELMEHARQHPVTDETGRVRPMRKMLNDILRLMWTASDDHDIPLVRYWSEHIQYQLDKHSVEDKSSQIVNRVQDGDFSPVVNDD